MKKLFCLLFLALPGALLAQVKFDPNILAFEQFQNDQVDYIPFVAATAGPPGFWVYFGGFPSNTQSNPDAAELKYLNGTALGGSGFNLTQGVGVVINIGGLSVSGFGEGIGFTLTVVPDGNINYIYVTANAVDALTPFQHARPIGFDDPAINMPPDMAVYYLSYGLIPQSLYDALYNGSSVAWQSMANYWISSGLLAYDPSWTSAVLNADAAVYDILNHIAALAVGSASSSTINLVNNIIGGDSFDDLYNQIESTPAPPGDVTIGQITILND